MFLEQINYITRKCALLERSLYWQEDDNYGICVPAAGGEDIFHVPNDWAPRVLFFLVFSVLITKHWLGVRPY